MPTRMAIRKEAAALLGLFWESTTTATTSTTVMEDTDRLKDTGESEHRHTGVRVTFNTANQASNQGQVRVVRGYDPSAGRVTFGNPFNNGIVSGDTYEWHTALDPREWNDAINRGLRECTKIRHDAITIVDDAKQYSLASLTALTEKNQLTAVKLRHGATAAQYTWEILPRYRWEVIDDDDALSLNLRSAYRAAATLALYIDWVGPYDALATDAATTTCPLDYAAAAAVKEAYRTYAKQISAAEQAGYVRMDQQDAYKAFAKEARIHGVSRSQVPYLRFSGANR